MMLITKFMEPRNYALLEKITRLKCNTYSSSLTLELCLRNSKISLTEVSSNPTSFNLKGTLSLVDYSYVKIRAPSTLYNDEGWVGQSHRCHPREM